MSQILINKRTNEIMFVVLLRHCESRPFVNNYIKKQMNFLIAENFVLF